MLMTALACPAAAEISPDWEDVYLEIAWENIRVSSDQEWSYYLLPDGTAMLTTYRAGQTRDRDYHVDIPSRVDGYMVTGIGQACFGDQSVSSVTFPETLTYVGGAFFCNPITSLEFPDSVTMIGSRIIQECYLSKVKLPKYLQILGDEAFSLTQISELTIPDSLRYIGCNPLAWNKIRKITVSEGHPYLEFRDNMLITKTDHRLVLYCNQAKDEVCTVPEGVEVIGSYAFCECQNLKRIILPSSVKQIEGAAFYSCDALEEVNLPEGLESMGKGAFIYCSALKSVTLPSTLYEVPASCFYGCHSLVSVEMSHVFAVRDYAFEGCISLSSVTGTDEIHVIGEWAFKDCRSLEALAFEQGEIIEVGAFYGCTGLRRLILPDPKHVEDSAFFSGIKGADNRYLRELTCVTKRGSQLAQYCGERQIPWEEYTSP